MDETIFGHARQAGGGPNTARQVSHRAGVPDSVPAFTVNKACASSLKALTLGALSIAAGENDVVLAGGTECMSATPYLLPRARFGLRMGHGEVVDGMYRDGFLCPLCGQLMGETAENLVREYGILARRAGRARGRVAAPRRRSDAIGPLRRRDRAGRGRRKEGRRGRRRDEHPRPDTTLESLAKLPPVFDENGTVHAGNSSGITDGAAALVLATEEEAKQVRRRATRADRGLDVGRRRAGADGHRTRPGDSRAAREDGRKLSDIDLIELNEAFAAQVIACAASCRSTWRGSTSTAARSPSATPSARPGPAS